MDLLNITLVQSDLHWENKAKNTEAFSDIFKKNEISTDIVILPEMFNTGFTNKTKEFAESMNGSTVNWMLEQASAYNFILVGSLIIEDNGNTFNRLIWASPDGNLKYYDKRHLFKMGGEDRQFSAGTERVIIEYKDWKICPLVCYDLRFPVWSRSRGEFDLLIYIANWPEQRSFYWKALLPARAIENQVYVAAVNRIGTDGKKLVYSGDTALYSPKGTMLSNIKPSEFGIESFTLSKKELIEFRNAFPFLQDADNFEIKY